LLGWICDLRTPEKRALKLPEPKTGAYCHWEKSGSLAGRTGGVAMLRKAGTNMLVGSWLKNPSHPISNLLASFIPESAIQCSPASKTRRAWRMVSGTSVRAPRAAVSLLIEGTDDEPYFAY
jgi:hypothetical protein